MSGSCADLDREVIGDAMWSFGAAARVLIVDLTGVEHLEPPVAEAIAAARGRLLGCRVSVLRRHGSAVDRVLRRAGA